jgi:CRISPR-associated protein Csb1
MLAAVSLFKIRKLISTGLRLRTACDLEPAAEPRVTRPTGYQLPTLQALEAILPESIGRVSGFADPRITTVRYEFGGK